jgi:hypothetical protein
MMPINPLISKDKNLWLAKRVENNDLEIDLYEKPILYKINYQPINGYITFTAYGEENPKMFRAIVKKFLFERIFKKGDKVYIDDVEFVENLEDENTWGKYANYVVDDVREQNITIEIIFKRNDKENL